MSYSQLGAHLTAARERAGLTAAELAVKTEFPLTRLLQLESGWMRPYENELTCLAKWIDLDVAALKRLAEETGPGLA